jgi:hypothetical protein
MARKRIFILTVASTKDEAKKFCTKNVQMWDCNTEHPPPTLDRSRVTKTCMENHEMQVRSLNRGCGAVPSAVTFVL